MVFPHTSRIKRAALVLASAAVLVAGSAAPAGAGSGYPGHDGHHGQHGKSTLRASLSGANERPKAADPDGRGTARVQLKKDEICFQLTWKNIDAPTMAHIHKGSRNEAGPVVVPFFMVMSGLTAPITSVGGCTDVAPALVTQIRKHPGSYYVNIHNAAYPGGAIRGQLHR